MIPKISILIPVYNVELYIKKCCTSLFSNTIAKDCEFIFVNDCSTDNSIQKLQQTISEFPELKNNIKIINHDNNKGLATARNTAISNACGKYIICVDSDDWVEELFFEKMYFHAENNSSDIVLCNVYREEPSKSFPIYINNNQNDLISSTLEGRNYGWLFYKLIRTSLFFDNGITWIDGINIEEDLIITCKIFFFAKNVTFISDFLYHYNCMNTDSLSHNLTQNKIDQLNNSIIEIENFLQKNNQLEKYKQSVLCRKGLNKLWILKDSIEIKCEYLELYNSEKLFKCKKLSLHTRFFFFLCYLKLYRLCKFLLKYIR